jgi:hypothetical protein
MPSPAASARAVRRLVLATALLTLAALVPAALAAAQPLWHIDSLADTTAAPGSALNYLEQVENVGTEAADATATPISFSATMPTGVIATAVSSPTHLGHWDCSATHFPTPPGGTISCRNGIDRIPYAHESGSGGENYTLLQVATTVEAGASGTLEARFQVQGGGAEAPASTVDPTTVTSTPPAFGIDAFDGQASDALGAAFTQAGGHPYSISTAIDFDTTTNPAPLAGDLWPVQPTKDVAVDLPPGLVGATAGLAQCTSAQLSNSAALSPRPLCPPTSQVGVATIRLNGSPGASMQGPFPVFNVLPPPDVPARFGFQVQGTVVTLDARLRSGPDYGLSIDSVNVSEGLPIAGTSITFWGVPADPSHDSERACPNSNQPALGGPSCPSGAPLTAFLRNPTSCSADPGSGVTNALLTTAHVDSWADPGRRTADGSPDLSDPAWKSASFASHLPPGYPATPGQWGPDVLPTGCASVPFTPAVAVQPTSSAAGATSGLSFDLKLPQSEDPGTIGESDLKTTVVRFPLGMRLSPSGAQGLGGCTSAQIAIGSATDPSCPDSSKLGTVSIETPLLEKPLSGSVYLASPHDNPFGSLVALYIVLKGPGVVVKLPGRVDLDPVTGQVTTTFDDNPQLPFSDLRLELKGGPHAAFALPPSCGSYTTRTTLTSWSGKTVTADSTFTLGEGVGGAPCPLAGLFAPLFEAGTTNPVAGAFSPLALRFSRSDADQGISSLSSVSLPAGALADVASVPVRCTQAQATAAACPAASRVGSVQVGSGAGSSPLFLPGDVYLMGPTKGQPFGLAVVVHAVAGPFDLGYVVVQSAVQINSDGSLTAHSDPFPQILQGIPIDLRDVQLTLDRPGFTFNPTNCNPMAASGVFASSQGATASVSNRFQVGDCASLAFKPRFSASTAGKTSKANGASFHVHLASNEGPHNAGGAGESNIAKVDVQLPVALPARLTTLQKACTAAQFASNPAGCPAASFVGSAIAHTPILASPLSGPAILVSHGGQAFPDLVLVLQGEGVRINLTGHTQIRKGITFSHFETVPDAPVASFDLILPQGPHSALTTDVPGRNLCTNTRTVTVTKRVTRRVHGHTRRVKIKAKKAVAASLLMPTTITAQNGAVIHQNTKIAVTGCAKTKALKHKAKKGRK